MYTQQWRRNRVEKERSGEGTEWKRNGVEKEQSGMHFPGQCTCTHVVSVSFRKGYKQFSADGNNINELSFNPMSTGSQLHL